MAVVAELGFSVTGDATAYLIPVTKAGFTATATGRWLDRTRGARVLVSAVQRKIVFMVVIEVEHQFVESQVTAAPNVFRAGKYQQCR